MNVMEQDDTSVTAHRHDHQQGRRTNDNQEGDDGTNDVTMHDEQGDAAAGSDNDDNVDDMPKHEGPITTSTRMTSDRHQWELASNNLDGSNCEEDGHRFDSSTQASSLSFIKTVKKDGKVNEGNGQSLEKIPLPTNYENDTNTIDEQTSFQHPKEDAMNSYSQNEINGNNAAMEEVTSSMLCLSDTARTALHRDYKVGLNPHLLSNANHKPHSSVMEVDTAPSNNGAEHYNNADVASFSSPQPSSQNVSSLPTTEAAAIYPNFSSTFPMQESLCHGATILVPTSAPSSSSIHPNHDNHKRRGSGYLLLAAAEAMERTESRENAIRRAAMQLVADAATANGGSREASETSGDGGYDSHGNSNTANASTGMSQYSARLQRVFEMPSLHADQLWSSADRRRSDVDGRASMTRPMSDRRGSAENVTVSRHDDDGMRMMEPLTIL